MKNEATENKFIGFIYGIITAGIFYGLIELIPWLLE